MKNIDDVISGALNNMKTLDEVIETAPFTGTEWTSEALYYLKEYRSEKKRYEIDRKYWEDELSEKVRAYEEAQQKLVEKFKELEIGTLNNPSLTWEQLKEMEGEPVFMDEYDQIDRDKGWRRCKWMLVEFVNDEYFIGRDMSGEQYAFYKVDKNDYSWQAYRKKRYE